MVSLSAVGLLYQNLPLSLCRTLWLSRLNIDSLGPNTIPSLLIIFWLQLQFLALYAYYETRIANDKEDYHPCHPSERVLFR